MCGWSARRRLLTWGGSCEFMTMSTEMGNENRSSICAIFSCGTPCLFLLKEKPQYETLLDSTEREPFPKRNQNIATWWRAPAKVIILSLKNPDPRPGVKLNPQSVPVFNISYQADVCFYKYSFFIFHATNRGKNVMTCDNLQMNVHDLMLLLSRLNSGS